MTEIEIFLKIWPKSKNFRKKIKFIRNILPNSQFFRKFDLNRIFFLKIWPKSKFFEIFQRIENSNKIETYRNFWPKSTFFEILEKIEKIQRFCSNRKFSKILSKMENFSKMWLKLKFFANLTENRNFSEIFYQNRNFSKKLTEIAIVPKNLLQILTKLEIFRKLD